MPYFNGINADCVKLLIEDRFSSMEAIPLLEAEDISPKILQGQQQLLVHPVNVLKKKTPSTSAEPVETGPEWSSSWVSLEMPTNPYI